MRFVYGKKASALRKRPAERRHPVAACRSLGMIELLPGGRLALEARQKRISNKGAIEVENWTPILAARPAGCERRPRECHRAILSSFFTTPIVVVDSRALVSSGQLGQWLVACPPARARRQIPVVIWEAPARMQIRTARQWRSRGPRINKSTTRPRSLAVYCAIMLCSREVILFWRLENWQRGAGSARVLMQMDARDNK